MSDHSVISDERRDGVSLRACVRLRPPVLGVLLLVGLAAGCQSAGYRKFEKYSYAEVPTALAATRQANPQTVDLSRLARASVKSDVLDRGDVVEISISAGLSEKDTVKFPVRINDSGYGQLPVIGQVYLAGLEPEAAEANIVSACVQRDLYLNPHVTVTMKKQRVNRVTVVGAVKLAGVYELPRGQSDLLAAITVAGGLAEDAGTMVEIRTPDRGGEGSPPAPVASSATGDVQATGHSAAPQPLTPVSGGGLLTSVQVDLISAAKSGDGGQYISDGAVVMVEKRAPEPVHVIGLVKRPNRYEFPVSEDLRMLDAVALAGGTESLVADKIFIVRRKPGSTDTAVIQASIRAAKRDPQANVLLSPGDVVSIESTPATVFMSALGLIRMSLGASVPLF